MFFFRTFQAVQCVEAIYAAGWWRGRWAGGSHGSKGCGIAVPRLCRLAHRHPWAPWRPRQHCTRCGRRCRRCGRRDGRAAGDGDATSDAGCGCDTTSGGCRSGGVAFKHHRATIGALTPSQRSSGKGPHNHLRQARFPPCAAPIAAMCMIRRADVDRRRSSVLSCPCGTENLFAEKQEMRRVATTSTTATRELITDRAHNDVVRRRRFRRRRRHVTYYYAADTSRRVPDKNE